MKEQRRHQRIRFNICPMVHIGQTGLGGTGALENLSQGGLTIRTDLSLRVGELLGCEFRVFDSPLIDMSATVVNKIGNCYGARFRAGPINECLIREAMDDAMASGEASILSVNDLNGRKVMRVAGGLNGSLHNDFLHGLTKVGVDEIDLSGVTAIDSAGLDLCAIAVDQHKVEIVRPAHCVRNAMSGTAAKGYERN